MEGERNAAGGVILKTARFCVHDGPGIRTTIFLKGCPLRCEWCHTPESQSFQSQLMFHQDRCRRCGACVAVCPETGLPQPPELPEVPAVCTACGACVEACLADARVLVGRRVSVACLLREVEKDRLFFEESGGGVTVSGGEPLAQPEFAHALLSALRDRRIHTALETCGYAPPETCARVCAGADLVLFDVKLLDEAQHRRYTGVSNGLILRNLAALAATGKPVVLRVPLIGGLNTGAGELDKLAALARNLHVSGVDLIPYHAAGSIKHRRLGAREPRTAFAPPSDEWLRGAVERLRVHNIAVRMGGGG